MKNKFDTRFYKLKTKLYKITILLIIAISIMQISISRADIEDEENIDQNEIQNEVIQAQNEIIQTSATAESDLKLNARIGLIYDRNSKTILYEKNGQKQVPMASTTKIMTSIVVLENANLSDIVTVDKKAASTGGSRLGLKTNDKITVHDLLYGLMLKSGNDAAVALAIHVGGSIQGFSELMNKKAKEMGLVNSHFVTPHGLDEKEHYTTAYELACMADYALEIPKFKEIVGSKSYNITINGQSKIISNTNELLGNLNGVYGIKTGFTNGAGRCLVTACKRDNLDIITVVLGADTKKIRTTDSIKLIEYAYKNYEIVNIKEIIQKEFERWKDLNEKRIYINKGKEEQIHLKISELPYNKIAIKKKEKDSISTEFNSLYYLEAPISQNQIIGSAKVLINGKILGTLDITAENSIAKKEILDYIIEFLKLVP